MAKTKIQWTETTWNPSTGCTKVSPGCKNCYAESMCKRLQGMAKQTKYVNGFDITIHPDTLKDPYSWKKPQLVFVNSMSDLFHSGVPDRFIRDVFDVMNNTPLHTYQVLTKRSARLKQLSSQLPWRDNIWQGVTVENAKYLSRIDDLLATQAKVKFLSLEPLLGPLPNLNLQGIDWVIVGGESGSRSRPVDIQWIRDIRDNCIATGVPFFFKQWGGKNKKKSGDLLDGRQWHQMP